MFPRFHVIVKNQFILFKNLSLNPSLEFIFFSAEEFTEERGHS